MAEMTLKNARELCTKAELELYQLSRGRQLISQDASTLQENRVRSRDLRDKWRDQSTRQRRTLQQSKGTRVVAKTDRSAQKAQLFQEMLDRFEARLSRLKSTSHDSKPTKAATKIAAAQRAAGHREERAVVRKELREKKQTLTAANRRKATEKKAAVKETTAKKTRANKVLGATATSLKEEASASLPSDPKPRKRTSPYAGEDTPNHGLQVNDVQQVKVQGKANQQRQKISGLTNRVRGHVSARGKRVQASRDKG